MAVFLSCSERKVEAIDLETEIDVIDVHALVAEFDGGPEPLPRRVRTRKVRRRIRSIAVEPCAQVLHASEVFLASRVVAGDHERHVLGSHLENPPNCRLGDNEARADTTAGPASLSHPLRRVCVMQVQHARRVRQATEELVAAVAELDLGMMLPEVQRELVALGERLERTGRTMKALAAAKVAESAAWRGEGDRSAEDWLARTTGTTRAEAATELQCGRDLHLVPEVARAATAGELSVRQTEAIAGAAAADPTATDRLLASAGQKGLRELHDECRATRMNADPDPDATQARIHAKRSYRTWTDPDGTGHLHLTGPADVIARIDNAVRHRCERIFREARRAGRREPSDAYAFDAAAALLCGGGDSTPVPAGADAKIIVRVDYEALLRGRALDGETCEIAGLGPVPVSVVQEWMGNAFLAAVLTKGTEITKVTHLGRRFTSEQRTALQWRDPVCARKGCDNRLGLQYDHFEDWAHTHTTRVTAAERFCTPCHRLKTIGWHVTAPDTDGQCTFSPPSTVDAAPPTHTTPRHELADAAQAALRARHNALART